MTQAQFLLTVLAVIAAFAVYQAAMFLITIGIKAHKRAKRDAMMKKMHEEKLRTDPEYAKQHAEFEAHMAKRPPEVPEGIWAMGFMSGDSCDCEECKGCKEDDPKAPDEPAA